MEHKLIQGGEQYLPFARSRIEALKALGLPYADQSFKTDDASIRVSIAPGHEYIRIEGGVEEYVYLLFMGVPAGATLLGTAWSGRTELLQAGQNTWSLTPTTLYQEKPGIVVRLNLKDWSASLVPDLITEFPAPTAQNSQTSTSRVDTSQGDSRTVTTTTINSSSQVSSTRIEVPAFYAGEPLHVVWSAEEGISTSDRLPELRETPGQNSRQQLGDGKRTRTITTTNSRTFKIGGRTIESGTRASAQSREDLITYSDSNVAIGQEGNYVVAGYDGQPSFENRIEGTLNFDNYVSGVATSWAAWGATVQNGTQAALTVNNAVISNTSNITSSTVTRLLARPRAAFGKRSMPSAAPTLPATVNVQTTMRPYTREQVDFSWPGYRTVTVEPAGLAWKEVSLNKLFWGSELNYGRTAQPIFMARYDIATGDESAVKALRLAPLASHLVVGTTLQIQNYAPGTILPPRSQTAFYNVSTQAYTYPASAPWHSVVVGEQIFAVRADSVVAGDFWLHVYPTEPQLLDTPDTSPLYEGPEMNVSRTLVVTNSAAALPADKADAIVITTPMIPPGYVLYGIKRDEASCM